jgi:hypothetical protein
MGLAQAQPMKGNDGFFWEGSKNLAFYEKEFEGINKFLGTEENRMKPYMSYQDAKKYIQSLNIKTSEEWKNYKILNGCPNKIPSDLSSFYKNEWEGWSVFLETGNSKLKINKKRYRSYEEAKKYAQSFKFKSQLEWIEYTKRKDFPDDIPRNLNIYKVYLKEFEGMRKFLGINKKSYN